MATASLAERSPAVPARPHSRFGGELAPVPGLWPAAICDALEENTRRHPPWPAKPLRRVPAESIAPFGGHEWSRQSSQFRQAKWDYLNLGPELGQSMHAGPVQQRRRASRGTASFVRHSVYCDRSLFLNGFRLFKFAIGQEVPLKFSHYFHTTLILGLRDAKLPRNIVLTTRRICRTNPTDFRLALEISRCVRTAAEPANLTHGMRG